MPDNSPPALRGGKGGFLWAGLHHFVLFFRGRVNHNALPADMSYMRTLINIIAAAVACFLVWFFATGTWRSYQATAQPVTEIVRPMFRLTS